jgi:hypothetical protein
MKEVAGGTHLANSGMAEQSTPYVMQWRPQSQCSSLT